MKRFLVLALALAMFGMSKNIQTKSIPDDGVILELRKQEKYPYHFAFLKRNNLAQTELGIPQSEVKINRNMIQNPGY
mgnify:CR=1 FL=1